MPASLVLPGEAEAISVNFSAAERTHFLLDLARAMKSIDKALTERCAHQAFESTAALSRGHRRSAAQKNSLGILSEVNTLAAKV